MENGCHGLTSARGSSRRRWIAATPGTGSATAARGSAKPARGSVDLGEDHGGGLGGRKFTMHCVEVAASQHVGFQKAS